LFYFAVVAILHVVVIPNLIELGDGGLSCKCFVYLQKVYLNFF